MPEGRMPEVVSKRHRLGQILVQREGSGDRAGYLGDFQRVGKTRTIVVALVVDEDLRLVLQFSEGARMDDPISISLKRRASRACRLIDKAAPAVRRVAGVGG